MLWRTRIPQIRRQHGKTVFIAQTFCSTLPRNSKGNCFIFHLVGIIIRILCILNCKYTNPLNL